VIACVRSLRLLALQDSQGYEFLFTSSQTHYSDFTGREGVQGDKCSFGNHHSGVLRICGVRAQVGA
jgi:hypothetical protein